MTIRLLVFDIDGVLTGGEAQALDLELLGRLAAMNRAARQNPALPAVTLCTGRPAPYLEVMLQAIDGHLPGVFENGAGLYFPDGYRFVRNPALDGRTDMRAVRQRLEERLVRTGLAFFQPGKEYTLTLFAEEPAETHRLDSWATEALGPLSQTVKLVYSTSCLNVLPAGVDKGQGIAYLSQSLGIPPEAMLGVGDSDVDLPFLALVGHRAAPANAAPAVKQLADYVASRPASAGVREILDHWRLEIRD
ncbi:MAG: Cof-type HAD-IIB family hydrolase [Chloroflexi bacterium]|nr:Cof-type HAD-IIB family hydrolase [Chloroflexota bacterium]MCI0579981.1 Cof-type HAD-IIB family hydrolase [Chloroflexota bacterium]MCI0647487.1 Cof-type HAD-IIB family hydrolase [Chloroflexota bacterium]MCI0728714.1 Cof-type HAD-IIB family hydrolase [Chloroflexota bacterium]